MIGPLIIGGEEMPAASGARFAVASPWDGELLGEAARAAGADVARAISAAVRAATRWADAPPAERERPLLAAAAALAVEADDWLPLMMAEGGATITKARAEVAYTVELLRAAAGEARRLYGDTLPHDSALQLSLVVREPLGVVAALSPFNAPLALLAKMVAFPLAVGNAVVAKPSELTPLVAVRFVRLLHRAGLPPGVLSLVTGFGDECGRALVADPRVRGIAFTGSTTVGRRIAEVAGGRLCRLQLELGGKNPLVVLADFDADEAAAIAVAGAYAHAGQICMAPSRIIVEQPLLVRFVDAMRARTEALHLGARDDARTAYGPLVAAPALTKVERHVAEARARGTIVLTGRRRARLTRLPSDAAPGAAARRRRLARGDVRSRRQHRRCHRRRRRHRAGQRQRLRPVRGPLDPRCRPRAGRRAPAARRRRAHRRPSVSVERAGAHRRRRPVRRRALGRPLFHRRLYRAQVGDGAARSRARMSAHKAYVSTAAGQLHYRVAGTRRPSSRPLVLLHQTASSSAMFEPLMARLADRRWLFAPDMPGFGGSDALPEPASIARFAAVFVEAMDRLEIARCDLFGHHSGASVAVQIAHDHPERVARLALSGPPYLSRAQLERLIPAVTPLVPDEAGAHLASVWRRIRAKDPTAPLELAARETLLTLTAGARYAETYHAVFTHDFAGQLARLEQPTLVMAGPDDTIADSLEPAFAALRQGQLVRLARGGTYVCDREPDLVAATLDHFFSEEESP